MLDICPSPLYFYTLHPSAEENLHRIIYVAPFTAGVSLSLTFNRDESESLGQRHCGTLDNEVGGEFVEEK